MLALLNILLLMSPISHNSSEIGVNYKLGYTFETINSNSNIFENYFYDNNAEGIGSLNGLNLYYNYYLSDNLFLGIETNYLFLNSRLNKTEQELINISGNEVDGEFEHIFEYDSEQLITALNIGYNIHSNFYFSLGFSYSNSISDINISSLEQISKPEDAGVFVEEQTRIRDELDTNISNSNATFGLMPSLDIKYPMNKSNSLFLNSSIGYNYSFNERINNNLDWSINSLIFSVGLSYTINNNIDYSESVASSIESNIISFELIDRIEISTEKFSFDVIKYSNLKSGSTSFINYSNGQSIVLYVQLKNMNNEGIEFNLSTKTDSVFNKILTDKLTKISIPKTLINSSERPKQLILDLLYSDYLIKRVEFETYYNVLHETSYLYSSNLTDLAKYIDLEQDKIVTLYTDDENISSFLDSIPASNVTVRNFKELEFKLDNSNNDNYLLVIE
jgi:hypothetical protein